MSLHSCDLQNNHRLVYETSVWFPSPARAWIHPINGQNSCKQWLQTMTRKSISGGLVVGTYLSLQAPFHSASLPQGFRTRTIGILPFVRGVCTSTWKHQQHLWVGSLHFPQVRRLNARTGAGVLFTLWSDLRSKLLAGVCHNNNENNVTNNNDNTFKAAPLVRPKSKFHQWRPAVIASRDSSTLFNPKHAIHVPLQLGWTNLANGWGCSWFILSGEQWQENVPQSMFPTGWRCAVPQRQRFSRKKTNG